MASQAKQIPPFLIKLYEMTNEVSGQDECFKWSDDGQSFWVSNSEQFSRDVLPSYFKHNNYASFVRQLNLYGFRRSTEPKGKVTPGTYMVEVFRHPFFVRGRKDMLANIHRKSTAPVARRVKSEQEEMEEMPLSHASEASSPAPHDLRDDVEELKRHNALMERELLWLRSQNQVLAAQQEQQSAILQSLITMLAKCGVSVPETPVIQQFPTPSPLLTTPSPVFATDVTPRAEMFPRDDRLLRQDSLQGQVFTIDEDGTAFMDTDPSELFMALGYQANGFPIQAMI